MDVVDDHILMVLQRTKNAKKYYKNTKNNDKMLS